MRRRDSEERGWGLRGALVGAAAVLVWGFTRVLADAAPVPEGATVAVVYNRQYAGSQDLARHYAQRRGVPTDQVFGFDLPTTEAVTREEFDRRLRTPLLKALDRRELLVLSSGSRRSPEPGQGRVFIESARIRYLVLCAGVPVKVLADPNRAEPGLEGQPPELRRNEASVDTELAVLPWFGKEPRLAGPLSNPGYGATNISQLGPEAGLLLVSRLDGPDVLMARNLVDKAIEAEQNGLWGRAYLDLRGLTNSAYVLGDQWLAGAGVVLSRAGFETVLDTNEVTFSRAFPMSQIGFYAGWYDASISGPFLDPPVEFMPGAFAYHLHSFSARPLRTRESGWVGPLLDRGATATVGYVEEPYLPATLDVTTFMARWVLAGFSYGEAVYAALPVLSWQATVVGDPLYRPFGRGTDEHLGARFKQLHFRLVAQTNALLEWSHLQVVNLGLGGRAEVPSQEMVEYLHQAATSLKSPVLAEKLGSVMQQAGRPEPAIIAYQQALAWGGTRQQRVRLLLELARLYEGLGQEAAALEVYERLITGFARHPVRSTILPQALAQARRLGRAETVARLEALAAEPP